MAREALYETDEIELEWGKVPFRLKRSRRRRTVALSVDPEAGLVVYCPQRFARWRLEDILRRNAGWIRKKTDQAQARSAVLPRVSWRPGALLPLQGVLYPLETCQGARRGGLHVEDGRLWVHLPPRAAVPQSEAALRDCLRSAYRELARAVIAGRVAHFQERLGVRPRSIRIKDQKRRWGSCSPKGNLNFNWRLILAPSAVLDYVVVHELCHLAHLDHSPRFWARVAAVMPGFGEYKTWLRENGPALYAY